MPGNTAPIYSKAGAIGQSHLLTTAANDYNGVSPHNRIVFESNAANGGLVKGIRFKARGTNVATVARIYIGRGRPNINFASAPAAPTGTPSTTGGTMLAGAYFATVIAIDAQGAQSVIGTYSAAVNTTGSTGSIAWAWTAVAGAVSYRLYVTYAGAPTGSASRYFEASTNSFTQTLPPQAGIIDDPMTGNQFFFGEISLPASTASATAATPDIFYPIGEALPPDYEIIVGLGTTVAAGWQVSAIGGEY